MSPRGLDVRLSLDLSLQQHADEDLGSDTGAVILLNAQSGEILVMASHPTFDPNQLAEIGDGLNTDPSKPLINRATQGLYPTGSLLDPFAKLLFGDKNLNMQEWKKVYETFGLSRAPAFELPIAESISSPPLESFHVSALQVALAGAVLSHHGTIPAPILASAVNTPNDGWVVLSAQGTPIEAVPAPAADEAAQSLIGNGEGFWSFSAKASEKESTVTWYVAGTPPDWQGTPLIVVVVVEESNLRLAQFIGSGLLKSAMNP